jgi:hypothetical protein
VNDGKAILFTSVPSSGVQGAHVEAVEVDSGKRQVLIKGARFPRHTSSGHLVFYRDSGLYAAPFDAGRLTVTGPPIEVTAEVEQDSSGAPLAEISSAGSLVYRRAGVASGQLVWVSRQGIEQPATDIPRAYLYPHLSADSRRIAVGVGSDLWIQDTLRSTFTRLTPQHSETASHPVWTPNGNQIVFRTPTGLRSIEADGSGRSRTIAARHPAISQLSLTGRRTTGDGAPHHGRPRRHLRARDRRRSARVPLVTGPAFEGGRSFS